MNSGTLAATEPFSTSAGAEPAEGMTTTVLANTAVANTVLAARAKAEAFAARIKAPLFAFEPSWRPNEDEVARAAIAVIFFALIAIISMAAGAILTMG